MYEVSNQFKEYCKRHIRAFKNATITYYDGDEQQTIESEEIIKFDISAEPYIDYQIIGQAVAKKIHISIRGSYDLANKEVNVTTTMIYDDNTEEVLNLGDYIIASDYDSSVKNQCSFTGYDYMIKMDDAYSDEGLTYPCTIQDVIENICEQKDIELATTDLPNGDLEVIGNNFQDGATYRDVIKQIAQVNGTFAYIDRENKLHIDTLMNHETLQGEGTSINLQGSTPYGNILDYMLKGNTTQNGTPTPSSPVVVNNVTGEQVVRVCGKNILPTNKSEWESGHYGTDGKKSAYNTRMRLKNLLAVEPNTTYWLGDVYTKYFLIREFDINGTFIHNTGGILGNRSFTTQANTHYLGLAYDIAYSSYEVETHKLFMCPNTQTDKTWQEYQGKDYEINLGKNLFDKSNASTNGRLDTAGAIYVTSGYFYSEFIKVRPNTVYTKNSPTADAYHRVCFYSNQSANDFISKSESNVFTTPNNCEYIRFCGIDTEINTSQLEKGTTSTTYAPYFTPIELNKIGNYQDFIRKGTGKNLYVGYNNMLEGFLPANGAYPVTNSSFPNAKYMLIDLKKGEKITTSGISTNTNGRVRCIDAETNQVIMSVGLEQNYYFETTIGYGDGFRNGTITAKKDIIIGIMLLNNDLTGLDYFQIERGNSATDFEPYGYKDKWYIEKNIGKVVLSTVIYDSSYNRAYINLVTTTGEDVLLPASSNEVAKLMAKYFACYSGNNFLSNTSLEGMTLTQSGTLSIRILTLTSKSDYETWLSNNNSAIYYVLNTPTYTLIENEELIEQLNALNNGYVYGTNANILVSGNIPSIINISVDAPGRDIEEEITPSSYLTDFKQSREYGPVNRVQITMTDVEDATYIENEESISKDGIQTITINDNYFLSSEELKAKAIRPLWNSLYTMKYMPISCKYLGLPYIEMNDYIGVALPNGNVTGTYVFNYKFTYNGGYMGELETPTISRTQETYPTESINSQVQKMGINVDRANARITSEIIARQETDENVTRIEQSIDEINLSVSTTQTDLSNLEGQVQTNTASIGVNADNISLAVEKNTQTQDQLDTLQTNTQDIVNQLVFNGDGLTISAIGSTSDDMKLNLTNDAINFMYNNNVILKINGSTIEFANASFQKLDLGNYVWVAEDDDSLSLIYEGE